MEKPHLQGGCCLDQSAENTFYSLRKVKPQNSSINSATV